MDTPDLGCSVFVNCTLSEDELSSLLCHALHGHYRNTSIRTRYLFADVTRNKDLDPTKIGDPLDGFIFYPYKIEIDPLASLDVRRYSEDDVRQYKQSIARAISVLRSAGMDVVAACSFEDELS